MTLKCNVLHGVLYPQVHGNGIKKKKKRLEYIRRIVPSPSYMEDPKMVMPAPELYPVTTLPDTRPDSGYADVD